MVRCECYGLDMHLKPRTSDDLGANQLKHTCMIHATELRMGICSSKAAMVSTCLFARKHCVHTCTPCYQAEANDMMYRGKCIMKSQYPRRKVKHVQHCSTRLQYAVQHSLTIFGFGRHATEVKSNFNRVRDVLTPQAGSYL